MYTLFETYIKLAQFVVNFKSSKDFECDLIGSEFSSIKRAPSSPVYCVNWQQHCSFPFARSLWKMLAVKFYVLPSKSLQGHLSGKYIFIRGRRGLFCRSGKILFCKPSVRFSLSRDLSFFLFLARVHLNGRKSLPRMENCIVFFFEFHARMNTSVRL